MIQGLKGNELLLDVLAITDDHDHKMCQRKSSKVSSLSKSILQKLQIVTCSFLPDMLLQNMNGNPYQRLTNKEP